MKKEFQHTDQSIRRDVILSSFALSVFIVLSFNAMISILVVSKFIEELDFDRIVMSFQNGYYTLNNQPVGVPLIVNLAIMLLLWYLMVWDTFRVIKKPEQAVVNYNKSGFLYKLVHLFF